MVLTHKFPASKCTPMLYNTNKHFTSVAGSQRLSLLVFRYHW